MSELGLYMVVNDYLEFELYCVFQEAFGSFFPWLWELVIRWWDVVGTDTDGEWWEWCMLEKGRENIAEINN